MPDQSRKLRPLSPSRAYCVWIRKWWCRNMKLLLGRGGFEQRSIGAIHDGGAHLWVDWSRSPLSYVYIGEDPLEVVCWSLSQQVLPFCEARRALSLVATTNSVGFFSQDQAGNTESELKLFLHIIVQYIHHQSEVLPQLCRPHHRWPDTHNPLQRPLQRPIRHPMVWSSR